MRIYLDNCCYSRPYDDQSYLKISLEAMAKMRIQRDVVNGKHKLISSYILYDEINNSKNVAARKQILGFVDKYADAYVSAANEDTIKSLAYEIEKTGIKSMDAMHLSCAIFADCDCFLTTDKRILKFQSEKIKVLNPLDLLEED